MSTLDLFAPRPSKDDAPPRAADEKPRAATAPAAPVAAAPAPVPSPPIAAAPAVPPPAAAPPANRPPPRPLTLREPQGRFSRAELAKLLNPPQLEAACYPPKPLIVVAGAGSGKTRVITFRLARLVAGGADPRRIFIVTFTNKAAGELKERAAKLLGRPDLLAGLWLGTFHSLSARLLRRYGEAVGLRRDFVIYDTDDQRRLMTRVLADLQVPERLFPVRQVLSSIDRAKNQGLEPEQFVPNDYFDDVVGKAYAAYEERLRAANAVDFGGLLLKALKVCMPESPAAADLALRFDHVLVDEFQDTNLVQYRLVRFLSRRTDSITVVGDEDQSIYRWRGADIRNILDFERDHPGAGLVKLEENYRSTGNVLRAANAIIVRNTERRPKRLFTSRGDGEPIIVFEGETERDEADYVAGRIDERLRSGEAAPRDFAVFYRTNGQSRVLEEALRARDIPYTVVGGTRFYDRAEVKDLICYLRAVQNPDDGMALERIINTPTRGIGDTTVERINAVGRERKMSFWEAIEHAVREPDVLGAAPRKKLGAFRDLMLSFRAAAAELGTAGLAEKILEDTGYRDVLAAEATLEAEGRLENLLELIAQMREYERSAEEPTMAGFLERVALVSDVDGYDPEKGAVSLMTVHTAKGLEFPEVFITGLEENIFPHARSVDDDAALEEERRLCYVAITRAMRKLHLSRVRRRRLSGQELGGVPSRFLRDLPEEGVDSIVQPRPSYYHEVTEDQGPWGGNWNRSQDLGDRVGRNVGRLGGKTSAARAPAGKPGELTVHYEADGADEHGLRVGAKLRHPQFGVGEVRAWQSSGADMKVTMRFDAVGVKTILAKYLTRV